MFQLATHFQTYKEKLNIIFTPLENLEVPFTMNVN